MSIAHKVTNHRHNRYDCINPTCSTKIDVTCSCGWSQGCATRAQAKFIRANHETHPKLPVVSSSLLMEVLDLRCMKIVAAEAHNQAGADLTNYFESLYS